MSGEQFPCLHQLTFVVLVLFQSCCPSSPCPSQLHTPRRHTPPSHMHPIATPLPAAWAMPLCPSQLHMPLRRAPPSYTHHLAAPLMAAHAISLHPSQMHASCCHPSHSHMCHITVPHLAAHAMSLPPLVATCTASPHLLQLYVPRCCTPPSCTHHITTPSRGCTHHVAAPPTAIRTTSLCPTQLHAPHHHPSRGPWSVAHVE